MLQVNDMETIINKVFPQSPCQKMTIPALEMELYIINPKPGVNILAGLNPARQLLQIKKYTITPQQGNDIAVSDIFRGNVPVREGKADKEHIENLLKYWEFNI